MFNMDNIAMIQVPEILANPPVETIIDISSFLLVGAVTVIAIANALTHHLKRKTYSKAYEKAQNEQDVEELNRLKKHNPVITFYIEGFEGITFRSTTVYSCITFVLLSLFTLQFLAISDAHEENVAYQEYKKEEERFYLTTRHYYDDIELHNTSQTIQSEMLSMIRDDSESMVRDHRVLVDNTIHDARIVKSAREDEITIYLQIHDGERYTLYPDLYNEHLAW